MIQNFSDLLNAAKTQQTMRLAVAAAQDEDVLVAVCQAADQGLVEPIGQLALPGAAGSRGRRSYSG